MDEQKRDFKGVWIPVEVYLDERLNALDKIILMEIDSLDNGIDGCYASNEYIAEFCQCKTAKVTRAISKLKQLGYLEVGKFDGRKRFLKSRLTKKISQTNQKDYSAQSKRLDINTSILIQDIKNSNINNICSRVVGRLNELNGTKYSPTSTTTVKFIKGRIDEGHTEEELLLVVEKMSYLWNQKENEHMKQYLRPSTLFRPTNFENYLNMPVTVKRTTANMKMDLQDFFK